MNSASAYKSVKRRMMAKKNATAKPANPMEDKGLLKRRSASPDESKNEDINSVIASYIEAIRGLED